MNKPEAYRVRARKRGESWTFQVFYRNHNDEYFTKKCSDQVANEIKQRIQDRIANGTFDIKDFTRSRAQRISLERMFIEYMTEREKLVQLGKLSPKTLETDFSAFKIFGQVIGKHTIVNSLTKDDIVNFSIELLENHTNMKGKPYSPGAVNTYLRHLSAVFTWAKNKGYAQENIISGTPKPKVVNNRKKHLSIEEIHQFSSVRLF